MKKTELLFFCFLSNLAFANTIPLELKSIYNIDNRELVSGTTAPDIQELSKSVGLIFFKKDLIPGQLQSTLFGNLLTEKPPIGNNYCSTEKFANHISYKTACTGFLIGKDVLATAGHCFYGKNDCQNKLIVFNVKSSNEVSNGFSITNNNIFRCSKIISTISDSTTNQLDYAVIKLDRKADLPVLKIRTKDSIQDEDNVFMIGHPLGLPLVYSKEASVDENSNEMYFKTTLNSFHGNSGSPVFNTKTHLVEGIMVRGERDEVYDEVRQCNRYAVYASSEKDKGEGVTRIKAVIPFIYKNIDGVLEPIY
jgi:V8-like Glu-specific endopeptidase